MNLPTLHAELVRVLLYHPVLPESVEGILQFIQGDDVRISESEG